MRPTDAATRSIAIAGDTATGLTTALACFDAGFSDLTLYSSTAAETQANPDASSVELSPNASRVLRTLKVLNIIRESCFEPQFIHQRSYRTGFQLSIQALGAMAEGRYHAPFLHAEQQTLKNALQNRAAALGLKQVKGRATSLHQNDTGVRLDIANQEHAHDVLIVADDPDDHWRSLANAESLIHTNTPFVHWQGTLESADLPDGAFGPVISQWLGPQHHVSYHYGSAAKQLQFSAITQIDADVLATEAPTTDANDAAAKGLLSNALAGWHPSLSALVERLSQLRQTRVQRTGSPKRLAHGRVLFLGSSCHPLLPHLPQQTALGIEDAWVAARMLEQWEEDPASGWIEYEKYRLPRARQMQTRAQMRAAELCEANAIRAWQRNLALSLGSRFLPELAMQKNDWLYGYDAINGFE